MTLEQSATPMFANHQTFHPRFGWIKKGFDAALSNPDVFNSQSAPVDLGVGKNMVDAIRFWALATKVITKLPHPDRPRLSIYTPTKIGRALLDDEVGLDPYMEDPATLWILHWFAMSSPSILPVWRLAFNDFTAVEFADEDLLQFCVDEIAATTWAQPRQSSVRKDVDCLLRMYTRRDTRGRQTVDELLDSPFRDLQLIKPSPGKGGHFRFVHGAKAGLPAAAVSLACLDFMAREGAHTRTVSLTRLAVDSGSPGRLLKLTEADLAAALEDTATSAPQLHIARPAGSRQLTVDGPPEDVALAVLFAHHHQRIADLHLNGDLVVAGRDALYPAADQTEIEHKVAKQAGMFPVTPRKEPAA